MCDRVFIVCVLLMLPLSGFAQQAPAPSAAEDRLERLERALQQLQERNAELEGKVNRLEARPSGPEQTIVRAREVKTVATGSSLSRIELPAQDPKKPVVFAAAGASEFKLTLGGFVQTQIEAGDVAAFEGRLTPGPENVLGTSEVKDRFRVRRARINVSGDYAEQFEFKLEGEFQLAAAGNSTRTNFAATDLFANWHALPELNVKLGQFKAPFGLEQFTADSRLLTIESSLATTAIAPDRQIGIQVWGRPLAGFWPERAEFLTYYAGIFNGTGRNISVNDNSEFMYAGRLEVLAMKAEILNEEATIRLGANGLVSRDDAGTLVSNQGFVNADGSLASFSLPTAGRREAYGFDVGLRYGGFELIAEYLNQRVSSREVAGLVPQWRNFRADGHYVQGSYFLIPEKLQLVAKWESFNPGQLPDDDIHSITGGLNYYIRGHDIKLLANYLHTWSDFRESNPAFGRDEFDEVIVRLQVMF